MPREVSFSPALLMRATIDRSYLYQFYDIIQFVAHKTKSQNTSNDIWDSCRRAVRLSVSLFVCAHLLGFRGPETMHCPCLLQTILREGRGARLCVCILNNFRCSLNYIAIKTIFIPSSLPHPTSMTLHSMFAWSIHPNSLKRRTTSRTDENWGWQQPRLSRIESVFYMMAVK